MNTMVLVCALAIAGLSESDRKNYPGHTLITARYFELWVARMIYSIGLWNNLHSKRVDYGTIMTRTKAYVKSLGTRLTL